MVNFITDHTRQGHDYSFVRLSYEIKDSSALEWINKGDWTEIDHGVQAAVSGLIKKCIAERIQEVI